MANKKKGYHVVLKPKSGLFDCDLKELWAYRDLISQTTKRTFKLSYKQTVLGPLWIVLNPLITALIYLFVFGGIAGLSTDGAPQILFYLGGNAVWTFFSTSLTKTASTFTSNAGVFGKVYFPRLTMPISTVFSALINFGVQMVLFLLFWAYYIAQGAIVPHYECLLLLPLLLLQVGLLALGFGILISALTTKYRDLSILVGFGVSLWMYITPVVYPISAMGEGVLKTIVCINPVTSSIELFKYIFLGQGMVEPLWWAVTLLVTAIVLLLGVMTFSKVEKTFMDTV